MPTKNIILFINNISAIGLDDILKIKNDNKKVEIAVMGPFRQKGWVKKSKKHGVDYILPVDYNKPDSITKALRPIQDRLLAITCRNDKAVFDFAEIIPYVPYLKTPTSDSLKWASDKILMRERFQMYDSSISPKFVLVNDLSKNKINTIIKDVEADIKYPVIVKPAHLHSSLLVSKCNTKQELESSLKVTFQKIVAVYKKDKTKSTPQILIEEFMDGDKYSVDAYVDSRGSMIFCPFVYNRSGRQIGFDDFFEYELSNRPVLTKAESAGGLEAATKAVHALALCNTSAHIELIKTNHGWKVIEVGARIGGFRHKLHKFSHGITHAANDVRVRIPQKITIPKVRKKYTGAFNFYARSEGRLESIKGINKVKNLKSFVELSTLKHRGDICRFAKHGGKRVLTIWLVHKDLKQWKKDIAKMEELVEIVTK